MFGLMATFSQTYCVSHGHDDVDEFVNGHLLTAKRVLFIGTVGIEHTSVYFPYALRNAANVDFRFLVENRIGTDLVIKALGDRHRAWLEKNLPATKCGFADVEIISNDGATVAGRNAVKTTLAWFNAQYSDIVVDSSGMSRGVCFPLLLQAISAGEKTGANVHLLMASNDDPTVKLVVQSNDRADWMHGFQENMDLDGTDSVVALWMPQLSEDSRRQAEVMYQRLTTSCRVAEVCPIVPFPARDPRRGDMLLFEYVDVFKSDMGGAGLSVVYAHEADPMDVFHSIIRTESARREVFAATNCQAVTVLSPSGWRLGSLGMVLAAITMKLPLLYVEAISYTSASDMPEEVDVPKADRKWHIWITGTPYATQQSK